MTQTQTSREELTMTMSAHSARQDSLNGSSSRPTVYLSGINAEFSSQNSIPTKNVDEVGENSPLSSLGSQQHTTVFHAQKTTIQSYSFGIIDQEKTAKGELVRARPSLGTWFDAQGDFVDHADCGFGVHWLSLLSGSQHQQNI
jgi:hypothetical protein